MNRERERLAEWLAQMELFLHNHLKLKIHPEKVEIKTIASGVDFLGWVNFPHHRTLRTVTKKRMLKRLSGAGDKSLQSYLGLLKHGDTQKLSKQIDGLVINNDIPSHN